MTRTALIWLAAGGSAALMLGALAFQYIGHLPPCKLCYWQRYPHVAAIAVGLVALGWRRAPLPRFALPSLGALAALATAAVGLYHTGVERKWWEGPTTCTSGAIGDLTPDELLNQIMTAPLIRCDEVAWQMLGLSMASWNMVISLGLMALWVMAARKT